MNKRGYSLMIGRFQPFHDGHLWMVREILAEAPDSRVWIAVRRTEISEQNPFFAVDIVRNIYKELREKLTGDDFDRCVVTIIPDIEGVHYGRGVGWRVVEHVPPSEIHKISATEIRKSL